jgi:hypothetical protein
MDESVQPTLTWSRWFHEQSEGQLDKQKQAQRHRRVNEENIGCFHERQVKARKTTLSKQLPWMFPRQTKARKTTLPSLWRQKKF